MKKVSTALSYLFLALLMGCMASHDPIKMLVKKLNATNGMWVNGIFSPIALPKDAKPEEIIARAAAEARINTYQIREIRNVEINEFVGMTKTCTAALVETEFGAKILLLSFELNEFWWSRCYDILEENVKSTQNKMAAIATAIDLYQVDHKTYPASLNVLLSAGKAIDRSHNKPSNHFVDNFQNKLRYLNLTNYYELRSAGPDREFKTKDDIVIGQKMSNHTSRFGVSPRIRVLFISSALTASWR